MVVNITLDKLDPSTLNFFRPIRIQKYKEIQESIETLGLLQPIVVRPKPNGRYEILAGHNRVEICKDLGWKDIKAIVKDVSDDEAEEIIADTNVSQRDDISPLEIAKAYEIKAKVISKRGGLDGEENLTLKKAIGKEYSIDEQTVEKYMQLNNLIPEFKQLLESEKIETSVGFNLGLLDVATQKSILKRSREESKDVVSVEMEVPCDTDDNILEILKNEPETVIKILGDYISKVGSAHNPSD